MSNVVPFPGRRNFLKASATLTAAATGLSILSAPGYSEDTDLYIVGPKKGYTPQIGTLVSEMAFMRWQVMNSVKGMSQKDLDFLLDDKANRIGALLLHLVATEKFYQLNTLDGLAPNKIPESWKEKWGMPMELGEPARKAVVGNNLDYYLNLLNETREKTLEEFRKRGDAWLMAVDKTWGWGPTNNYCKWFHVTEHEANHNGQIKFLKSRLPGAKPAGE
ncbi:MAG TPA: DUF664 domain-containing protein [Verrucomicrobiae bacterium]|nr:DUF664 domain-containing protein [Verrucomicrobiae bacterium]